MKIVPLAKIIKPHGVPGRGAYVAFLFSKGAEIFKDQQSLYVSEFENFRDAKKIDLEKTSPLAAAWPDATKLLIKCENKQERLEKNHFVGLSRDQFPPLADGEFYIYELIGFQVLDEQGAKIGVLKSYFWHEHRADEKILMRIECDGLWVECPYELKEQVNLKEQTLVFPNFSMWKDLAAENKVLKDSKKRR